MPQDPTRQPLPPYRSREDLERAANAAFEQVMQSRGSGTTQPPPPQQGLGVPLPASPQQQGLPPVDAASEVRRYLQQDQAPQGQAPDSGGFGNALLRVLPLLITALSGMKSPAAGGGFAEGILASRDQQRVFAQRQEELDLRRDRLDREHRADRAREAEERNRRSDAISKTQKAAQNAALAEPDPDIAAAILAIAGLTPQDMVNGVDFDSILDTKATNQRTAEASAAVTRLIDTYSREELVQMANAGTPSPRLRQSLLKTPGVVSTNGTIPLIDLLLMSREFIQGPDGQLIEAPPTTFEEIWKADFALRHGYASVRLLPTGLRAEVEREFTKMMRDPEFEGVVVDNLDGTRGLMIVNKVTGEAKNVAGVTPAGGTRRADIVSATESAVPVIDNLEALAIRINTTNVTTDPETGKLRDESYFRQLSRGILSRITGVGQRFEAAMNVNEDVALYMSTVAGFTPLLARAVGHTGVLTEQDVQRTMLLLPRPGNSKEISDAKIALLRRIMDLAPDVYGGEKGSPDFIGRVDQIETMSLDVADAAMPVDDDDAERRINDELGIGNP